MTVVAIIAILVVLSLPVWAKLRARAQRAQCMGNLRSLHVAAELYLQENNQWPQIRPAGADAQSLTDYGKQWSSALSKYNIAAKTWICPTIQNLLGNPDYIQPGNERFDYIAMPFDDKPTTPHQWPRQPWFVENGDVHGMATSSFSLTAASAI